MKREPHCLWLVVPRSLVIYSMIGSRPTLMKGIDSSSQDKDTPLWLLLWNCSQMQTNWALVQQDGWTTGGALGGERALLVCINIFHEVDALPRGIELPRPAWVQPNHLRTAVSLFQSSMHKWGMPSTASCECGAEEQTADHTITSCSIYHHPNGIWGLLTVNESLAR